ncbi:hypothetical protein [uncultured Croceitalea sp.]|uniref:hypothetical protein n=1 Tax=uncultured Croceitalea sp. TaxID=1798908 RepID=UPI003305EF86
MKIATYNIQNLFHRSTELLKLEHGTKCEIWSEEFEKLFFKAKKTPDHLRRLRELADLLGFHDSRNGTQLSMSNMDGSLHARSTIKVMETRASYRTDWNGWTRLNSVPINKESIINKAKVILETDPDILLLQQVENRASLLQFHDHMFKDTPEPCYHEIIHLQGNGTLNLGMGLLLKKDYRLVNIKSYANERDANGNLVFDTDFIKYKIKTPENRTLYLLNCQFSNEHRTDINLRKQAEFVAKIYEGLKAKGFNHIVIAGTFNAASYSKIISPIMDTEAMDIVKHGSFDVLPDSGSDSSYFRMGAYRMGVNIKQRDYLMASPSLFGNINNCGMNRKALWPLKRPQWDTYDSMRNERDAASEHPLLWANFKPKTVQNLFKKSA